MSNKKVKFADQRRKPQPDNEDSDSSTIDDMEESDLYDVELGSPAGANKKKISKSQATSTTFAVARANPKDNMPYLSSDASLFSRINRLYWFTVFAGMWNAASILICILMYAHDDFGKDNSLKYSAAGYFGTLGTVDLFFGIIILCRNRFLQHTVMDRSFQQNNRYHIIFSMYAIFNWVLHGMLMMILKEVNFTKNMASRNTSGLTVWVSIFVMAACSIETIRRDYYVFYHMIHWVFYVWILVFGSLHSPKVFAPIALFTLAVYVIDFLYHRYRSKKDEAEVTRMKLLPGGMTRVDFTKEDFEYKAGQFVYINFPDDIGTWQWHPFSISTAPYQQELCVHIRNVGDFTNQVYKLAKRYRKQEAKMQKQIKADAETPGGANSKKKRQLKPLEAPRILIDGPYGLLTTQSHELYNYKHIVFICGGSGVTPVQSLFNDFLHEKVAKNTCTSIARVDFIWSVKEDRELCVEWQKQGANLEQVRYIHFQPNLLDHKLVQQVMTANPAAVINVEFCLTRTDQVRLRSFKSKLPKEANPKLPEKPSYINLANHGVDLDRVIREAAERVEQCRDDHLAVIVCGPSEMVSDVQKASKLYNQLVSNIEVHVESFLP
jgi:predicted ferric reductase